MALKVTAVAPESPAACIGLQPGDELISIGPHSLDDMLDYQYHTASMAFELTVRRAGRESTVKVIKGEYEPFGCDFATYLASQKHSCTNHCMFCFIDQLPPGMRETLYFKDDDERLSFLYGNYITLTNMSEHELERIKTMHISPINISVHTTNPALRVRMLANRRAAEIMDHLKAFAEAGIEMNCQLVVCRGINDGDELRRTLADLGALHEHIRSIAAVPAGVTRYRDRLFRLKAYDAATSAAVLDILEEAGDRFLAQYGTRLVYPGDEWYLAAGRPLPQSDFYEDFAQLENGVGMWRDFHDSFLDELARPHGRVKRQAWDLVTGELAAPLIRRCAKALEARYPQVKVAVHAIRNDFFGGNVTVAGLVTGSDIRSQCQGRLSGGKLGVPEVMLRAEQDLFLDNVSLEELGRALGATPVIIPAGGDGCCRALLGKGEPV